MRIEVPQFNGADLEDWIFNIQKYLALYNTPIEQRVKLASLHMTGAPFAWHKWMQQANLITTWDAFLEALGVRFGTTLFEDPRPQVWNYFYQDKGSLNHGLLAFSLLGYMMQFIVNY